MQNLTVVFISGVVLKLVELLLEFMVLKIFFFFTLPLPKQTKNAQRDKLGFLNFKKIDFYCFVQYFSFLYALVQGFISNLQILWRCQCNGQNKSLT